MDYPYDLGETELMTEGLLVSKASTCPHILVSVAFAKLSTQTHL